MIYRLTARLGCGEMRRARSWLMGGLPGGLSGRLGGRKFGDWSCRRVCRRGIG